MGPTAIWRGPGDDRVGLAVITEALRQLRNRPHTNNVQVAATVQEEIGLRGASVVQASTRPDIVINLEIGIASDFPLLTSPTLSHEITPMAATKVQEFLRENGRPEAGLRVRVVVGGCSGFQYQLALDDSASEDDEVFEQDGVKLFVDPQGSFLYLDGTEIDYVEDIMGSGFRFSNPNGYCQIERVTDRMGE